MATHWHVLGAGAIGCLFAALLQRAGCKLTLVLRESSQRPGQDDDGTVALVVKGQSNLESAVMATTCSSDSYPVSHLLITTKAYDARRALAGIAHRLSANCQVLLMVNGMGLLEELERDQPHLSFHLGTTTEGAYRTAPFHIHHAGRGHTHIGRRNGGAPPAWFSDWSRALDSCSWEAAIDRALWRKLAINCAINPLTAVHGCRNGELATRPDLAVKITALCAEIAAICSAAGYADIAATLPSSVAAVIAGTADNRSSMLQDVLAGRQTEIDHITGYLLAAAAQHGVAAPVNGELLAAVRALRADPREDQYPVTHIPAG